MTSGRARRRMTWAVPVVVAGGVAAAVALTTASPSGASPSLPGRTPQQLLVAVQKHATTPLSGEVSETVNLGLPSLPGAESRASLSWQSFLTGSHTLRVWVDGADKQRVALLGQLSEADIVHNGDQVWTYTSDSNSVSHSVMQRRLGHAAARRRAAQPDYTPGGAAARVLAALRPSTDVTVGDTQQVAGRDAYTLVFAPKDANSTVGSVQIAVDATSYVPLEVKVLARNGSTIFSTGFTDISYDTPAASVFTFHKPAGSASTANPFTGGPDGRRHHADMPRRYAGAGGGAGGDESPTVIGSGWTGVVELHGAQAAQLSGGLLEQLTSPVGTSGERMLRSTLVNALFTADGRVFAGAVTPQYLQHVAATHPR